MLSVRRLVSASGETPRSAEGQNPLFALAEESEDHPTLPHNALVVCPCRQFLSDVTTFAVVDAVHKVDVGFEWQGREIGGAFRDGVDETVQMEVVGRDRREQLCWSCEARANRPSSQRTGCDPCSLGP